LASELFTILVSPYNLEIVMPDGIITNTLSSILLSYLSYNKIVNVLKTFVADIIVTFKIRLGM